MESLGFGLSTVSILAGGRKLLHYITGNEQALANMASYAKVFPLSVVGFTPNPSRYLLSVGVVELSCGLALMIGRRPTKLAACKGLMVMMALGTQTLISTGNYKLALVTAGFFVGLFALHRNLSKPRKAKQS